MKVLLKICLLLAVGHILFLIGFPHVLHYMLDMRVREVAATSTTNSETYIKEEILGYAMDKNIPIQGNRLHVWRKDGGIRIWLEYDQVVRLPFHTRTTSFTVTHPPGTLPPSSYSMRRSFSGR